MLCDPYLPKLSCHRGHEALVAHFRNSTVMHANPEWRPVVFDTAGDIEHFPPVSIYGTCGVRYRNAHRSLLLSQTDNTIATRGRHRLREPPLTIGKMWISIRYKGFSPP
jgi:hypothetical protein